MVTIKLEEDPELRLVAKKNKIHEEFGEGKVQEENDRQSLSGLGFILLLTGQLYYFVY